MGLYETGEAPDEARTGASLPSPQMWNESPRDHLMGELEEHCDLNKGRLRVAQCMEP